MWLWVKIFICILFVFLVFSYLKFSFIKNRAKGRKIKKGSKEEFGLFLYHMQHEMFKPLLKDFLKDTIWIIIDSAIISGIVISFIYGNWSNLTYLVILRLFIFVIKNRPKFKGESIKVIERDIQRYKEIEKKRMKN